MEKDVQEPSTPQPLPGTNVQAQMHLVEMLNSQMEEEKKQQQQRSLLESLQGTDSGCRGEDGGRPLLNSHMPLRGPRHSSLPCHSKRLGCSRL